MTTLEWKVLIAILAIFVIGGIVREFRKSPVSALPAAEPSPTPKTPTSIP